jgi:hypothetical protein
MVSAEEKKKAVYTQAIVYDYYDGTPLAKIALNGYTIRGGGALNIPMGAMRSFKMMGGSLDALRDRWSTQDLMRLRVKDNDVTVRVSALPAEEDASGFIEFLYL